MPDNKPRWEIQELRLRVRQLEREALKERERIHLSWWRGSGLRYRCGCGVLLLRRVLGAKERKNLPAVDSTSDTWGGPYHDDVELFNDATTGSATGNLVTGTGNSDNSNIDPALVNTTEPVSVIQLVHTPVIPSPSPPTSALPIIPTTSTILTTSLPSRVNLEPEGAFNFPQHLFSDNTVPTPSPLTGTWPTTTGPQLSLSSPWKTLGPQASFPVTVSAGEPVPAAPASVASPVGGVLIPSQSDHNPGIHTTSTLSTPPPVTGPATTPSHRTPAPFPSSPQATGSTTTTNVRTPPPAAAPVTTPRHSTPAPFQSPPPATSPATTPNVPIPLPVVVPVTTPSRSTPAPFQSPPPATSPTTTPNVPIPPPVAAPATMPSRSTPTPFPSPPLATGLTPTPHIPAPPPVTAPSETTPSQPAPSLSTPAVVPPSTFPQTRPPLKPAPVRKTGHQNERGGGVDNTTEGRGKGRGKGRGNGRGRGGHTVATVPNNFDPTNPDQVQPVSRHVRRRVNAVNASGGQPASTVQSTYWTSSNPAGENPTITFPALPPQDALSARPKRDVQRKRYADGTTVPESASVLNGKRPRKALTSEEIGPSSKRKKA